MSGRCQAETETGDGGILWCDLGGGHQGAHWCRLFRLWWQHGDRA